jgi:hypothetical protein
MRTRARLSRPAAVCGTAQTTIENCDILELGRSPEDSSSEAARLKTQECSMLYTIAVILLIAWLLGVVGTYTIGAFVHVLLVIAIVLFLVGLLSGRRTLG